MKINNITPTESRLILNPYKLSGRELIISSINEMIFLKAIRLESIELDGCKYQIIKSNKDEDIKRINKYQLIILNCIKEHYQNYPETNAKDYLLIPYSLLLKVYEKLDFNYFNFKRVYIMWNLEGKEIFRQAIPFYYLKSIHSKKGKKYKSRLKYLLNELKIQNDSEIKDWKKIKGILIELGPNIILVRDLEKISKKLNIEENKFFKDSDFQGFLGEFDFQFFNAIMSRDYNFFPDEFPNFDFPDSSSD